MRSTQINRVPLHSCLFALKLYGVLYLWLGWQVMPAMLPHLHHSLSLCLFRTLYTWTMLEINVINARKCSNSVISWPQALPCCERCAPVCVWMHVCVWHNLANAYTRDMQECACDNAKELSSAFLCLLGFLYLCHKWNLSWKLFASLIGSLKFLFS